MMPNAKRSRRPGRANAVIASLTASLGICAIAGICYLQPSPTVAASPDVTQSAVATILARCGLTAESLAAAGLDAQDASAARLAVVAKLESDGAALNTATEALATARSELDSVRKAAQGEPTEQEAAQIAAAAGAASGAEATLASVIDQFVTAGTVSLSEGERATLATIRSNHARTVPAPYLVHSMDDEAYVRLRDALAAERTALKLEEEVPADAAAHLATVRAVPSVAAALSNTAANLASIKTALAGG